MNSNISSTKNFIEKILEPYGLNPLRSPKTSDAKFCTFFGVPITLGKTINWFIRKAANSLSMRNTRNPNQALADLLMDLLAPDLNKVKNEPFFDSLEKGFPSSSFAKFKTEPTRLTDDEKRKVTESQRAILRTIDYLLINKPFISLELNELTTLRARLQFLLAEHKIALTTQDMFYIEKNPKPSNTNSSTYCFLTNDKPRSDQKNIDTFYTRARQIEDKCNELIDRLNICIKKK
ncbi:MAG: hypothetical protein ACOYK6_06980 [Chthoniobacterales bacterium]